MKERAAMRDDDHICGEVMIGMDNARDDRALNVTRRRFLLLSAAAAGTALLAACGGTPAPTASAQPTAASLPPTQVPAAPASTAGTAAAGTALSPSSSIAASSAATSVSATGAPTVQVAAGGKPGGKKIFRVGTPSEITELDPARTTTQVNTAAQEALFNYAARYTYTPPLGTQINPELADSWEVQDGARTYIFHLHKGVTFTDGYGDLTADDIKWNWDRVKDPKTASSAALDFAGSTITVLDPYTLKVAFDHPYPAFINATVGYTIGGMMISPKAYQALGDKWITHPIGSGPFMWDTYRAGTSLTLKRNPDYWGTKPKIDAIDFHMKFDDRTAVLAVAKGEIDAFPISDPDVAIAASKSTDPNMRFIKAQYGEAPFQCWFNMRRKPLDDVRVRQALCYAIDSYAIAKDLFGGLAQPVSSYLPPFMFGYSDNVMHYEYNPGKAKQLLKDANVSPDWQPEMISQSILTISRRITEAVASYWTDVGVKVKNSSLEQGIITKRGPARDYDMYATYVTRIDPDQMTARFWRSNGASNYSGYSGGDDLIDKLSVEPDPQIRAQLYHDLQNKLSTDAAAAFTVAVSEHIVLNKRVSALQGPGWFERYDWFNVDVPAE